MEEGSPSSASGDQGEKPSVRRTKHGCQAFKVCVHELASPPITYQAIGGIVPVENEPVLTRLFHSLGDDREPSCSSCMQENKTCIRQLATKFRHGWNPSVIGNRSSSARLPPYSFRPNQHWCRTRRPLTFVDENRELLSLYEALPDDETTEEPKLTKATRSCTPSSSSRSAEQSAERPVELPVQAPSVQPGLGSPMVSQAQDSSPASFRVPTPAGIATPPGNSIDWLSGSLRSLQEGRTQPPTSPIYDDSLLSFSLPSNNDSHPHHHIQGAVSTVPIGGSPSENFRYTSIGISALINTPESTTTSTCADPTEPPEVATGLLRELHIIWPLESRMEAHLFRYFIEFAARWFDLCDGERSFSYIVPCRAILYSPLLYAMFAVSARHLSLTSSLDKYVADRYYQRCLRTLRPMLSDEAALVDENLFAATVILRYFEEIEVPLAGAHPNTHLLGNSLFVKASAVMHDSAGPSASIIFSGLRRAAFLVAVRQEIFTAFVSQRSISPSFGPFVIEPCLDVEGTDYDWANRAVFHLADVIRFCYGTNSSSQEELLTAYDQLEKYSRDWFEKKPLSLSPIFYSDPLAATAALSPESSSVGTAGTTRSSTGAKFFPEIWLMSDAAATGLQHYHLARILLFAFDPRAPRLGPSRATFARLQDSKIREEVRCLVGIAKSNSPCRPNYVSACMGIAVAGERFEEHWEQMEVMDFLEDTESMCAWPTGTAKVHLSEAWGWSSSMASTENCPPYRMQTV